MNKTFLILGIILIAAGIAEFFLTWFTTIYQNRVHRGLVPTAGLGLTVLGALIVAGGFLMGKPTVTANQFKCDKCGAVFGSQTALAQHSKDKHGIQAS